MSSTVTQSSKIGFWVGLLLGGAIIALAGVVPRPDGLTVPAVRVLGIAIVVGAWWITEALPLGATALLPFALFPIFKIAPAKSLASAYGAPIIFLLLGGFFLALAVERSGVHKRLALHILLKVGTSPRRLVLGFAIAAAVLSMWISNTATTLIMMPIAIALSDRARDRLGSDNKEAAAFSIALLLGTGYGASVGGMGTPVGTPPNLLAIRAISANFPGESLTFLSWLSAALPVVVLVVPIVWLGLTRLYPKVPQTLELGADAVIRSDLKALGGWRRSEIRSLIVLGVAAVLWITRPDLKLEEGLVIEGWARRLGMVGGNGRLLVHDGTIAMLMAVVAFALPSGEDDGERLLPWSTALRVPWGLVLLFGGGLALSGGFKATGLSQFMASGLAPLAQSSLSLFTGVVALLATFGTEVVSNTALASILMPILADTAKAAGQAPLTILFPAVLACSCAFMMPAATGPNAIVFGTGRVRIAEMVKAGFVMNWLAWVVIVAVSLIRF